jgi:hypothetical protein
MNKSSEKILLLNPSNLATFPVFPYAFIQVPAVARKVDVEVICKDLLGIPLENWKQTVKDLIKQHDPTMIFITLRNTDSLNSQDYDQNDLNEENKRAYFPIERTKDLITAIRTLSKLKIALGGFGFSVLPGEIMHYLRPDFGVVGGSDGFFEKFEDIKAGKLGDVANLLFFQDGQLISNPRKFYPPLADIEYNPQVIKEMLEFYDSFSTPGLEGAPIEIMRGCNHSCVFCSEPLVGGKQVRYRDLSLVMADIELLVDHGINQIYMISSELNPEGNSFVLQLAERILSFNNEQPKDQRITWFGGNYLLNFSFDEYERLYKSGFTGGWFDITALDDDNARVMRTPYRNKNLLTNLKIYAQFERRKLDHLQLKKASQLKGEGIEEITEHSEDSIKWTLFLGNPSVNTKTIHNTLQVANREGLAQLFNDCYANKNIRVFDYENLDKSTLDVTYSFTSDLERVNYRQMLPSFAYSPALLQDFGSEKEITSMFEHITETYLSTKYLRSRDWHSFVKKNTTTGSIESWVRELQDLYGSGIPALIRPTLQGIVSSSLEPIFHGKTPDMDDKFSENLAKQVVESLLLVCLDMYSDLFGSLGLPNSIDQLEKSTPYDLAVVIFSRWSTEKEIGDELIMQSNSILSESMKALIQFCVQSMLYKYNVLINPKYKGLFTL